MNPVRQPIRIAILGAGISGLSAGYFLKREFLGRGLALDVKIIDCDQRVGGRLRTTEEDGIPIECGPDSIFTQLPDCYELCTQLGLRERIIFPRGVGFGFYREGRVSPAASGLLKPYPKNLSAILHCEDVSLAARLRASLAGLFPHRRHHNDYSVASYFRHRYGEEFSRSAIEPLMSGIYAASAEELSAQFLLGASTRLTRESSHSGTRIKRKRAQKSTSAVLPPYFSFQQGIEELPKALANQFDACELILGTVIHEVQGTTPQRFIVNTSSGNFDADYIISCLPVDALSRLFPQIQATKKILELYTPQDTTIVNLLLPKPLEAHCGHLSGCIVPKDKHLNATSSRSGTFVQASAASYMSKKWPRRDSSALFSLRLFYRSAVALEQEENLLEIARQDLALLWRIPEESVRPTFFQVDRWQRGSLQYNVGYPAALRELDSELRALGQRLFMLGPLRSSGIPGCVREAKSAAKSITQRAYETFFQHSA